MTRVSFSADPPALDISLPRSWKELADDELRAVYRIMTGVEHDAVGITLFRELTGARLVGHDGNTYKFAVPTDKGRRYFRASAEELTDMVRPLEFVETPGDEPVRLRELGKCSAVDARFHGVSFGDYIRIESLYQGYITSRNPQALLKLAALLYPGLAAKELMPFEEMNIVNWMVQLKQLFSCSFRNFFRPAEQGVSAPSMLEIINTEIRALTGGDVTKEDVIYGIDCWRALTELDFKAKEAEEFNRLSKKNGR